jgi:hypothetical protein
MVALVHSSLGRRATNGQGRQSQQQEILYRQWLVPIIAMQKPLLPLIPYNCAPNPMDPLNNADILFQGV